MKNEIKDLQIDIQRDEHDLETVRQIQVFHMRELLALKELERKLVQSIHDRKRLVARYGGK
ncbi:hypothetical protein FV279_14035 [Escherichia coli]|uniref:hypothetical protein n=1 Tax=Escherichia coli TaxID=562 RepID=UPI0011C70B3D|nr:hypothetical protein [Escherichia coli]HBP1425047.1 hypothetical protein [Escherichia coli str. K-12 substr. MG1655star]MBB0824285.1 hypothetical protein [Escherichia coli]MDO1844940.1 hypothetical protein [Escherichia coli]TXQ61663.1 hypothetical protein FV279_14035 [Escherichia coli]TYE59338.1 hypothetical protein DJ491_16450 [Escherichia coli]